MEIILAETAGFCFGVERAVELAYKQSGNSNVYTYGPIIHNSEVVNSLKEKGITKTMNIKELPESSTLIIRSHGVGEDVYKQATKNNVKIVDATCPYVKKIHKIVKQHSLEGNKILIVGDKDHPEIRGIVGWIPNNYVIIKDISELKKNIFKKDDFYCIVSQTTYKEDNFKKIIKWIEKNIKDYKLYDTICRATSDRQKEAMKIAKNVDYMIIIGDKTSSNTQKLYEVSSKYCKNTMKIETADELELNNLKDNDRIGVTAGASTPDGTIKEAILKMQKNDDNNKSFAQLYAEHEETRLRKGQIVTGKVIGITQDDEVAVDLGHKFDGIITKNELSTNPDVEPSEVVDVGEEIEVYVSRINDAESTVVLSKRRVDSARGWKHIEEAYNKKAILTGTVRIITKGGVIVPIHGTNVFIPISLLASRYIDDLSEYKDQEINFQIIEIDARRRRVIGNRKALLMEKINKEKKKAIKSLEVDTRVKGTVKNITGYGIFVDLGGIDGFAHISNLAWKHIKSPKEVVQIGDEIEVSIMEIDEKNLKVSLTMKFSEDNPWNDIDSKYPEGSIILGKVVRIVPFGAFIEIEEGLEALLHISQISTKHVDKVEDELREGEKLDVKILKVDSKARRINVSRKVLLNESDKAQEEKGAESESEE